jgi:hypothetical protein
MNIHPILTKKVYYESSEQGEQNKKKIDPF